MEISLKYTKVSHINLFKNSSALEIATLFLTSLLLKKSFSNLYKTTGFNNSGGNTLLLESLKKKNKYFISN